MPLAAGYVLEERHHVLRLLGAPEGEDQQGVVRRRVGVARGIHVASREVASITAMLDSYRRVLARPGALAFSGAALVARLPMSMVGLGIVLLVEQRTGSYGLAGTVAAVFAPAEAAFAVLHGRWVDHFGQSRVLPLAITVFGGVWR